MSSPDPYCSTDPAQSRLIQQNISAHQRADFHKWLRYYFDFCINHGVSVDNPDSFIKFDQKLIESRQTEENRQLAHAAITIIPNTTELRRYHLHETHVQKAIKLAVNKSRITKRASPHSFI